MTRKRVQVIDRGKDGKPKRWQAFDVHAFDVSDASARKMTREGFMVAPANIAGADNVQEYSAVELGLEGTNRTIRLFRPKDEVFRPESYVTYERQTLTNNHPEGDVSASNFRAVTIGDVHDVGPADDHNLGANLTFKDKDAIEYVVHYGKNQLSCGYSFVLDMTAGVSPSGEAYDGVMRDIVGNHVALVWNARGGPGLRVADQDPTKRKKTMKILTINGTRFEVGDDTPDSTISLIERETTGIVTARDTAQTALRTAETSLAAATDAAGKAKTAHDAEVADLKAKIPTAEQFTAAVADLKKAEAGAKAIVGDSFDATGKTVNDIRVAAIDHVLASKDDSTAKTLALTNLAGVAPAKADATTVRLTFDGIVAIAATVGGAARSATDEETRRAFAPDPKTAKDGAGSGAGRVIKYRTEKLGFGPKAA